MTQYDDVTAAADAAARASAPARRAARDAAYAAGTLEPYIDTQRAGLFCPWTIWENNQPLSGLPSGGANRGA